MHAGLRDGARDRRVREQLQQPHEVRLLRLSAGAVLRPSGLVPDAIARLELPDPVQLEEHLRPLHLAVSHRDSGSCYR